MIKRLSVMAVLMIALAGTLVTAAPAGAIYYDNGMGMTCGYPAPAPNAVATCSQWATSANGQASGWSYKIDATHHYGNWGGAWDPGTWHVIVYLYHNGNLWGQMANLDIGDWAFPMLADFGPGGTQIRLYNAVLANRQAYRICHQSATTSETELDDTANGTWNAGNMWPWARDIQGGSWCQHGFGSHGSWVRNGARHNQLAAGGNWAAATLYMN